MHGRWRLASLCCLLTSHVIAYEKGDRLVITRPVDMQTITGSVLKLTPGTAVTTVDADGPRLKVAAGRVGWIDESGAILAKQADEFFSRRLENNRDDAAALLARGKVRFELAGLDDVKVDLALADLDRSIELAPTSEAHTIRGYAWKRKGYKDRAIAEFDEAIRLNSQEALAWRIRGATWAAKTEYAKALADYSESIRVDPENTDSLHHRVVLRSACQDERYRDGQAAIQDATKACELSEWKNSLYISGLALACAESGDFETAIKWQQKAIALSAMPPASLQANLELFQQRKPFRMTWR